MNLIKKMYTVAVKLEKSNFTIFDYPLDKQKKYLEHFKEPEDYIDRSYYQYRCQSKMNKTAVNIFSGIAAFFLLFYYYFKKPDKIGQTEKYDTVCNTETESILPSSLKEKSGRMIFISDSNKSGRKSEYLTKEDKKFFRSVVKRHPISFMFLLKILMKLRFISYFINKYQPSSVIVSNEYSYTSSVMTYYCSKNGAEYINVMHGEKLFYIRDSFFKFDKCYIWDDFYKDLFIKLRADKDQFITEVPPSLKFKNENVKPEYDYTYYFGTVNNEVTELAVRCMGKLKEKGYKVAIRPHPRYSDIPFINSISGDIEIEDFKTLGIEESVLRTKNTVAIYSTVLNQAYNSGVGIVIDDVSDIDKYSKLKDLDYILLSKDHVLLSELLK